MECNCSNTWCWSKLPVGSVTEYDENKLPKSIRVAVKRNTPIFKKIIKTISYQDWIEICDNMGCDRNGVRWLPYVPNP